MEDKYITFNWPEELKELANKTDELTRKYKQTANDIADKHIKSCKKFLCRQRCKRTSEETEILKLVLKERNANELKAISLQRQLPDVDENLKNTLDELEDSIIKSGIY